MRYAVFTQPEKQRYPIALLVKSLRTVELRPFVKGIEDEVVAYTLPESTKAVDIRAYLAELLPYLCDLRTEYVIVTDAATFKTMTKTTRVDSAAGYVLSCAIENFTHINVLYAPSPRQVLFQPDNHQKVDRVLQTIAVHRQGLYSPPGESIVHFEAYPRTLEEIKLWLAKLLDKPLAIDIETFSLKHYAAGIGTICMCWSEHEGIAFCVDKDNPPELAKQIRDLLRKFFEARHAQTLYHRAAFDVYVLVYQLFMDDVLDQRGLLYGLEVMLRNFDDTLVIRYLATNSCAGNTLGLKEAAQEFAGNYSVEVEDISSVPRKDLLRYNLYDGLGTWYVFKKHWPTVIQDEQVDIYVNLFKPCLWDIIQMQLTGLPVDMAAVRKGKHQMQQESQRALDKILSSPYVAKCNQLIGERWATKRNSELKKKQVTPADCPDTFNVNSGPNLQVLLYEVAGLPVVETTDSGAPATGKDTLLILSRLPNLAPDLVHLLEALVDYKQVDKILSAFIPALEKAYPAKDGWHYLFGNFNLCGTQSGRLSSSDPNLQNMPASKSAYAKPIKQMFRAPNGRLYIGLDFNSLEDMISALTTKDPNKLKVYTDGFDGHCLRAHAYFGDRMTGIDPDDVKSINSIKKRYPEERRDSKGPTFAMTYQGTWRTLVTNCGFSPEKAKGIVARYNEMYAVSLKWVQDKLSEASSLGYVTLAFGLRLRTPMLKQTVANTRSTPYEAIAEGRSAGNALGQSYCMLNSRAAMEFMRRVRASKWKYHIRPCAQIHDAMYFLIDDNVELLAWVNKHLVECVKWQGLPEIQHPTVKLGGELSVFHPTWADELIIPNGADTPTITKLAKEYLDGRK